MLQKKTMNSDAELSKIVLHEKGPAQNKKVLEYFKEKDDYIVSIVNDTIKQNEFVYRQDITEYV